MIVVLMVVVIVIVFVVIVGSSVFGVVWFSSWRVRVVIWLW